MKQILYFVFLVFFTAACSDNGVTERLNEIDSLAAHEQYDSAYLVLSDMDKSFIKDEEDRAHYHLLRTQLTFVLHKVDSIDALDDIIIPYYSKTENKEKLANAYYCKGYSLASKGDYAKATYYYKKAEEQSMVVDDDRLLYKVYESLAAINDLTGNYKLELDYAKKALKIVQRVNNNKWTCDALYNMALAFSRNKQKDSSLYYINKMEPFLKYVSKNDLPYTQISIAYLYKHTNPEKAKFYLEKALSETESSYALVHLANIYLNEGNVDKAYILWKKALNIHDDKHPKDKILHNILEYDIIHGNIDHVCETVNEIIVIKDSIINSLRNDTIKDLQLRFDHEIAMRKQETITNNWQKGLMAAFLFIALLIAYIIIKRYREKARMQEAQIQINDLTDQIRELEESEEDNTAAIQKLNDQIKDAMDKEGILLKQGKMLYDQIVNGGITSEWHKKEFELFNNYYKAIDYKTVNRLERVKRKEKLTPQKLFFLLLIEMGYEKKDIPRILNITETSVNTLYFRTRPIEKD